MKSLQQTMTLHNGIEIPYVGLGVYKMEDKEEAVHAIETAIKVGYRSIDTAWFYQNEDAVGEAVRNAAIPREQLFITTKVWNDHQGYDSTLKVFENSLQNLQMDYVDLYLIHWPVKGKYLDTWKALERLYDEGVVKAIGVSNFQTHHLEDIFTHRNEKPVINQVELHPRLSQEPLRAFCQKHQIAVEAWSPLARARFLQDPTINEVAKKYGKSPAQVILRWHLQNEVIIIPKSVTPARIKENADLFDFELSADDMDKINKLNKNQRFGKHPDHFAF